MPFSKNILSPFVFAIAVFAYGICALASELPKDLQSAMHVFTTPDIFELQVTKTITSPFRPKPQTHSGKIFIGKQKFRMELGEPDKTLTVYDGKSVWNVRYASEDMPGKNQVVHRKISDKDRKQDMLLQLMDPKMLAQNYDVNQKEAGAFSLKPKDASKANAQLKDVVLRVHDGQLSQISYKDEIDNEVSIQLTSPQKLSSPEKSLFTYAPSKTNDHVEEVQSPVQ